MPAGSLLYKRHVGLGEVEGKRSKEPQVCDNERSEAQTEVTNIKLKCFQGNGSTESGILYISPTGMLTVIISLSLCSMLPFNDRGSENSLN